MAIANQIRTVVLLGLLTGLLLWIGSFWGQQGLFFGLVFAIIMNFGAYWFSDKLVLAIYRAKPVSEKEQPKLYKIVKEVSKKANIPMPKVYVVPGPIANAFATGRNYKHAAVAATEGILNLLNEKELEGVIAHEISHIKNRDTLIQAVAATIAGVISYIAMLARWGALFGIGGRDNERGGSGLELLVLAILTPILATLIQLAISRSREFLADESGASYIKDGKPLASALKKLEISSKQHPLRFGSQATSHLFIINPFSGRSLMSLFSTHPNTEMRIQKLNALKF